MFTRTFSRRPQPSPPSAAPRFAVQRFIQPRLTAERERSAADEGLEEREAEAFGLERVKHAFVPTLPPGAPGESAPSPPVPRNGSLGSRILRQELAKQPAPRIGPPGPPPLIQAKLFAGPAGEVLHEPSSEEVRSAAAEGVRTPAVVLPHLGRIQASFGHHPIGHVKAHLGAEAIRAARAMNARAFTSGDHVVFGGTPDLRTAAHEAAHVVQQRAGVQLAGSIGREGDAYEHHADAAADAVVAGRSAAGLLEPFAAPTAQLQQMPGNPVQRMPYAEVRVGRYYKVQTESGTQTLLLKVKRLNPAERYVFSTLESPRSEIEVDDNARILEMAVPPQPEEARVPVFISNESGTMMASSVAGVMLRGRRGPLIEELDSEIEETKGEEPPGQGLEDFRFPAALYETVRSLPKVRGDYLYDYDGTKMLAKQDPKGREMRQRESLIKQGAWHNEESRKQFELWIKAGVLANKMTGNAMSGAIQYVLSEDWKLYGREASTIPNRKAGVHTALLAGDPVRSAGWIVADRGRITRIGNDSGHYQPMNVQLYQLIHFLEVGGVDLSTVEVHDEVAKQKYQGKEYEAWLERGAQEQDKPKGKASKSL
jgi:hypothetical protein